MDRIVCTKNPPLPPALTTYGFGFVCARDSYFFLKFKAINKLYCVDYINEYIIILSFSFFLLRNLAWYFGHFRYTKIRRDYARPFPHLNGYGNGRVGTKLYRCGKRYGVFDKHSVNLWSAVYMQSQLFGPFPSFPERTEKLRSVYMYRCLSQS